MKYILICSLIFILFSQNAVAEEKTDKTQEIIKILSQQRQDFRAKLKTIENVIAELSKTSNENEILEFYNVLCQEESCELISKNIAYEPYKQAKIEILEARAALAEESLKNYFISILTDLTFLSKDPAIISAFQEFSKTYELLGDKAAEELQEKYIHENPNPWGQKERLDDAKDGSEYSQVHKKYHSWLRSFTISKDYYDLYFIDINGNTIYSVFKELDFAVNANTGAFKDTELGNLHRRIVSSEKKDKEIYIADFRPYAPSHGVPAQFFGLPVYDENNELLGSLIIESSRSAISRITNDGSGLGMTGEISFVGADYYIRNDSRFSPDSTILKRLIRTDSTQAAINGNTGDVEEQDFAGIKSITAYRPFVFNDLKWAIIANMHLSEIEERFEKIKEIEVRRKGRKKSISP